MTQEERSEILGEEMMDDIINSVRGARESEEGSCASSAGISMKDEIDSLILGTFIVHGHAGLEDEADILEYIVNADIGDQAKMMCCWKTSGFLSKKRFSHGNPLLELLSQLHKDMEG